MAGRVVSFRRSDGTRVRFRTSSGKRNRRRSAPMVEWVYARGKALPRSQYRGTKAGQVYQIGRSYYMAGRDGWLRRVKRA